jgi:hypothetical protein
VTLSEIGMYVNGVELNFEAQPYYDPRITPVEVSENTISSNFNLRNNYPNPFNPSTTISYELESPSYVELDVYDISGRKVAELVNEYQIVGSYNVVFDILEVNPGLTSGIYYYSIKSGEKLETKAMVLIK